jgi:hypothetical protein
LFNEYITEDNIEDKTNKDILNKYINNRHFQKFLKEILRKNLRFFLNIYRGKCFAFPTEMNGIEKHSDLKNYSLN